jgi:peptidyl-tRNA hydrolase, PTH1 family
MTLRQTQSRPDSMHLIAGLGNPGPRYAHTRHNVGFAVVERVAARWGFGAGDRNQFGALVGDGQIANERCILARPQSFMNRSGPPVVGIAGFYKLRPGRVLVIHDDLDLKFGDVRCKAGGGHGGHNGLRDIKRHLESDFLRIRVGIGRPPEGGDVAAYVLGNWTPDEASALEGILDQAADAVESILRDGVDVAMNQFNVRTVSPKGETNGTPPVETSGIETGSLASAITGPYIGPSPSARPAAGLIRSL